MQRLVKCLNQSVRWLCSSWRSRSDTAADNMKRECARLRARLRGKIGPLAISGGATYCMYRVCRAMVSINGTPTVALLVVCSLCFLAFDTAMWIHADPQVLRMLIVRPQYDFSARSIGILSLYVVLAGCCTSQPLYCSGNACTLQCTMAVQGL